jgi:hypothetical protein
MDCREFERRMESAVENRDPAALRELERHAAACGNTGCREAWEGHVLLDRAIAAWRPLVEETPDLTPAALRELRPAPRTATHSSQHGRRQAGTSGVAFAASVAAAILVLAGLLYRGEPEEGSTGARARSDVQKTTRGVEETPQTVDSAPIPSPASESYVDLAQNAAYAVTDLTLLIVPGGEGAAASGATARWIEEVGATIEPVKNGVSGKLHEWFGRPET